MGEINYLKFLWGVLYLLFAAGSCWATAESLHLTWANIPSYVCWVIAIGFYLIASIGATMIAKSLDKSKFIQKRGALMCGGIVIMILFWLICSMPTNTHTFLYRNVINTTVTNDITTTSKYLTQIETNEVTENTIQKKCEELKNKIDSKLQSLESEINSPLNPGVGPNAKKIMTEFPALLSVDNINFPSIGNNSTLSVQQKQQYYAACRKMIYDMLPSAYNNIRASLMPSEAAFKKMRSSAKTANKNLKMTSAYIENGQLDVNNPEHVLQLCDNLDKGYVVIKAHNQFVNFQTPEDKSHYTGTHVENKVKHIISVFDLWRDFFTGKQQGGLSMVFCIIMSVLVDLAAFVFFYLVQKDNY